MNIKIGCDPELFAQDKYTGKYVSVHNLLKGTKTEPFKVRKGAYQVDGVAAEFNIEPAETKVAFCKNISLVRRYLDAALEKVNPNLILRATPSVEFDKDYFCSLPLQALELGCEPDFNAYSMEQNPKPFSERPLRTGSGHVHIGWTSGEELFSEGHITKCIKVVKALDTVVYPQSLLWDSDDTRRELYGKRGDFRPKHYGVEYRTLSNKWVEESWTQQFIFDVTKVTVEKVFKDTELPDTSSSTLKECLDILETNGFPTVRSYAPESVLKNV